MQGNIHTPELTTLGTSAKGWIRRNGALYLHKVGKYEIPADEILTALNIPGSGTYRQAVLLKNADCGLYIK